MDQKTVFTQMQQAGSEWLKLMAESTSRFTQALAEVEKFEKQGVAQAATAVDEASSVAKEAITAGEQISAQWRKAMNEYAQRTLELLTPKN
jgi:DNA anti-recombination protein RmuC